MLCESAERPPGGRECRYELKLDGFRAIGRKSGRTAQLWSCNQKDFTSRFPKIVKGIAELPKSKAELVDLFVHKKRPVHLLHMPHGWHPRVRLSLTFGLPG
jgi:ATP-dependent DNA ligase